MKPWLSKAAEQLRDQIDTWYPDRRTTSDGWIGDARHSTTRSDHNPDKSGVVRAIAIANRLKERPDVSVNLHTERVASVIRVETAKRRHPLRGWHAHARTSLQAD